MMFFKIATFYVLLEKKKSALTSKNNKADENTW